MERITISKPLENKSLVHGTQVMHGHVALKDDVVEVSLPTKSQLAQIVEVLAEAAGLHVESTPEHMRFEIHASLEASVPVTGVTICDVCGSAVIWNGDSGECQGCGNLEGSG